MKNKRITLLLTVLVLSFALILSGCEYLFPDSDTPITQVPENVVIGGEKIPAYSSDPIYVVNGNTPFFTADEITTDAFYRYTDLDTLGRAGVAFGCIGPETLPDDEREDINHIYPSGWKYNGKSNNNSYDASTGVNQYIYNRAHLLANQLVSDDVDERNFFTGTCDMNQKHMVRFENQVADYVKEDGGHVMYRVTPYFEGNNLISSGVLMEGYSVEDEGDSILFCVFIYNVQPNIYINYLTGENCLMEDAEANDGCKHTKTEIRASLSATCTSDGYTGDTWCNECNTKIQTGALIQKIKHSFGNWVPVTGTQAEKRTCTACSAFETRSVTQGGTASPDGQGYTIILSPAVHSAYKLMGEQETTRFFNGGITTSGNSKGLNTTTEINAAADIYFESAGNDGSYYIYFYKDGGIKYLTVNGTSTTSLVFTDTKETVWTVDSSGFITSGGRTLGCFSGEYFRYYSKVSETGEYRPLRIISTD